MDAIDRINARIPASGFSFQVTESDIDQGFIRGTTDEGVKFWRKLKRLSNGKLLLYYNAYNESGCRHLYSDAEISKSDQRLIAREQKQSEADLSSQHLRVADLVQEKFRDWRRPEHVDKSAYLRRKKLFSGLCGDFIRGEPNSNIPVWVIPMWDEFGRLMNIQQIWPSGEKRFWAGARTKGLFAEVGLNATETIYLAEGFATAASVCLLSGAKTYCAFSKGNLEAVLRVMLGRHTNSQIVLVVDWDAKTKMKTGTNPGLKESVRLAKKYRIDHVLPFDETEPWPSDKNVDYSDFYVNNFDLAKACLGRPIPWGDL